MTFVNMMPNRCLLGVPQPFNRRLIGVWVLYYGGLGQALSPDRRLMRRGNRWLAEY